MYKHQKKNDEDAEFDIDDTDDMDDEEIPPGQKCTNSQRTSWDDLTNAGSKDGSFLFFVGALKMDVEEQILKVRDTHLANKIKAEIHRHLTDFDECLAKQNPSLEVCEQDINHKK